MFIHDVFVAGIFLEEGQVFNFLEACRWAGAIFELEPFIGVVAAPADGAFSPGDGHAYAAPAAEAAVAAIFELFGLAGAVLDVEHEILHFQILLLVVLDEVVEGSDPPLLDELVVAGELPGYLLLGVFGREVIILSH